MCGSELPGEQLRLVQMLPHAHPVAKGQQRVPEIQSDVDGELSRRAGLGETAKSSERLLEMAYGLAIGCPRYGAKPCLAEICGRLLPQLAAHGVVSQPFRLLGHALGRE